MESRCGAAKNSPTSVIYSIQSTLQCVLPFGAEERKYIQDAIDERMVNSIEYSVDNTKLAYCTLSWRANFSAYFEKFPCSIVVPISSHQGHN